MFGDPLAITFFDPGHSDGEDRYLTFGYSTEGRLLVVSHTDRGNRNRIITPAMATRRERESMKRDKATGDHDELRPEYHRDELKGGVRGKYLEQYRRGTNLACWHRMFARRFQPTNP